MTVIRNARTADRDASLAWVDASEDDRLVP